MIVMRFKTRSSIFVLFGMLSGGLVLVNDSGFLGYNDDFAFDAGFPTDPFFSQLGDDCTTSPTTDGCKGPGEINGIAFGNFNSLAASEQTLVGSLSLTGTGEGVSALTMSNIDMPAHAWYDVSTNAIDMGYSGQSMMVSAVPDPAAPCLFGAVLLGLVGISRRRG